MMSIHQRWFALGILLVLVCLLTPIVPAHANPASLSVTASDSLALTKQKVRDWIQTRIATARLQNKMKAHAAEYEDVVQAFFAERKTLLESRGWTVDEFDAAEERITAATSAMDMADELEASKESHQQEIAEIRTNKFYSDKQKAQMIEGLRKMRVQKQARYIEPTKGDWPAVRPYREPLQKMTSWIAGNIPHPPEIK